MLLGGISGGGDAPTLGWIGSGVEAQAASARHADIAAARLDHPMLRTAKTVMAPRLELFNPV